MDLEEEWELFQVNDTIHSNDKGNNIVNSNTANREDIELNSTIPKCEDLYISTKTKVLFLNQGIDIYNVFWNIPVIPYSIPKEGVVKKQIKIVSNSQSEYDDYCDKLENLEYYHEHIIKQINNPGARRIKFRDERKLTIGISKKDIMNCRSKVKNAFYNCFAIIMRFVYQNEFKEIHVKIFNTGKMEIPGILDAAFLEIVKKMILQTLIPLVDHDVYFVDNRNNDSVLINSNFNCGFYINREKLHSILRSSKYNIEAVYDPCSYPGVKCKFYFHHEIGFDQEKQCGTIQNDDYQNKLSELNSNNKYTEVSFMIFRTGSCLIVGNCSENILMFIYDFIKSLLQTEYLNIYTQPDTTIQKEKKQKTRKKQILVSPSYFKEFICK
jgi:TATA-box binding protein (TBP) (component of TFIID and TFIIIB)